jgi:hypothetical protein
LDKSGGADTFLLPLFICGDNVYNFKKDAKVYIETGGSLYLIDVYPDITFSQTFNENTHKKKTLHNQLALNQGATIVEANPVSFSFTTPIRFIPGSGNLGPFDPSYSSGNIPPINIYVAFTNKTYLIQKCAVENLVYNISRDSMLTVSVSGSGARIVEDASIPLQLLVPSSTAPYVIIRCVDVEVNQRTLSSIAGISIEVNNSIEWTQNTTINSTLKDGVAYKENYVLTERRVSGSITEFVLDESYGEELSTSAQVVIKLSSALGQSPPYLTFTLPEAVYTRRTNIDELLTRVYDFRLLSNDLQIIPTIRS